MLDKLWNDMLNSLGVVEKVPEFLLGVLPTLGKLVAIIVMARLLLTLGGALITRLFVPERRRLSLEPKKAKTLEALLKSLLRYSVYFLAALMLLPMLGIDTNALLASAGILGVALGFGAQSLVRDVLTGFFIVFEDHYVVGDYIEAAGVSGYVEEIGLRTTKLRDFSGVLHIIPNGEISRVTNHTRGNRSALVDVSVAYEEDVNKVQAILDDTMQQLAARMPTIVEGPKVLGITNLGASEIVFRIWAKTLPMEQWAVEREIRKTIKLAFDEAEIEIPYPRVVTLPFADRRE